MSSLTIHHVYKTLPFPEKGLHQMARKIYRNEGLDKSKAVSLVLCSDYSIKKLNSAYRDKNKPTDVLSFSFDEPDLLGEIFISLQRASVQARRFGFSYDSEILRLFIHGMIHLIGHDHEIEAQRVVMEAVEAKYWKTIL